MELRDNPELMAEYIRRHRPDEIWPEIPEGIRAVGITAMDIFILGARLVMILEAPDHLDLDQAFERLATLPRQQEWEDYMAIFQQAEPGASSAEKWQDMTQIFALHDV